MTDFAIERAVAYTPEAGDSLLIEVPENTGPEVVAAIRSHAEKAFDDVQVIVLVGCHFAGVVKDAAS